jgi:hypothetical protein
MKSILYIFIGLSIVSCNNRLDPLKEANTSPLFNVNGANNIWASEEAKEYSTIINDSVKIFRTYSFNYKIEEEEQATVFLKTDGFKGKTEYESESIGDSVEIIVGEGILEYTPYIEGLNSFNYTITDPYKNSSAVSINLTCFENLLPVSDFEVTLEGINDPLEYRIDSRSSFDADAKFGGGLLRYRLMIDLDTIYNPSGLFHYIFNQQGNYTIGVQVMDNDSIWGLKKEISYNVQ